MRNVHGSVVDKAQLWVVDSAPMPKIDEAPTPIQRATEHVGGRQALAKKLGITYQAVEKWCRLNRIPADRVLAIELATDGYVSRYELRPDLYPRELPARRRAAG